MIRKFVDSFIPAVIKQSEEDLRKERIFIAVLLISALSDLLGISLAFEINVSLLGYLLFTNALVTLILLGLYKKGFSKQWATHIYIFQHLISFGVQAWYQGGLISPAIASCFLLPAVAILLLGKNSASFWFAAIILMITGFYIYETSYGPPEIIFDNSQRNLLYFGGILGTNLYIFIILIVYENNKNRALSFAYAKNTELQAAQQQIIQSEKMASLGELTAGIAHEIQNPLNFVNNFSEVSIELLDEMAEELENGDLQEVKAIARDVKHNLGKIHHHGQRADSIVKGMLQHSRKSLGKKVATDLNKLADEYLRLAYHGLRAKDKSFNATLHTNFDPSLEKIPVVSEDIGRVLLNLLTNAFHAIHEKKKNGAINYQPQVTITSKALAKHITIVIADNGKGIPQDIRNKIFQPFFTTKPTGEGTGLGLSLSYDIIKAHGGKIEVETEEGNYTNFTIILPKNLKRSNENTGS